MTAASVKLVLEDGTETQGQAFGVHKPVASEVVFNTAQTGYVETLQQIRPTRGKFWC